MVKDKMKNPYETKSIQKFLPKQANRSKHLHQMQGCFRAIVCGATGSGKSAWICNLLDRYRKHFNHIVIFTAETEPIYDWLQSQIPDDCFSIYYNDLSPLEGDLSEFFYGTSLCIIDDMVTKNKKQLKPVMDLFIRGRKIHQGVSICFLSQSYFDIPKIIRQQISYCILVKINNKRDLRLIMSEFNLNCTIDQLMKMYEYCCLTDEFGNVLTIDKVSPVQSGKTYRCNFLEFLDPKDFN